jgi:hypothetical protein
MKKIVTASRANRITVAVFKWSFSVFFVMGVSMFVNDAFIGDVTAPARGTDVVVVSAFFMRLVTGFVQDRLATVSLAGAFIFMVVFELSDWLGWPTGIQNTAGILMAVFSAVCMVRVWKIDARG